MIVRSLSLGNGEYHSSFDCSRGGGVQTWRAANAGCRIVEARLSSLESHGFL